MKFTVDFSEFQSALKDCVAVFSASAMGDKKDQDISCLLVAYEQKLDFELFAQGFYARRTIQAEVEEDGAVSFKTKAVLAIKHKQKTTFEEQGSCLSLTSNNFKAKIALTGDPNNMFDLRPEPVKPTHVFTAEKLQKSLKLLKFENSLGGAQFCRLSIGPEGFSVWTHDLSRVILLKTEKPT